MGKASQILENQKRVDLVVLDRSPVVSLGLRSIANTFEEIEYAGGFSDKEGLLEHFKLNPESDEILLIDLDSISEEVGEVVSKSLEIKPRLKVVILGSNGNTKNSVRLLSKGVKGFISKQSTPDEIYKAITAVIKGATHIDNRLNISASEKAIKEGVFEEPQQVLTKREIEILKLISEGFTNVEIAEQIGVSRRTVDTHRFNIIRKVNTKNIVGALRYGFENDLF